MWRYEQTLQQLEQQEKEVTAKQLHRQEQTDQDLGTRRAAITGKVAAADAPFTREVRAGRWGRKGERGGGGGEGEPTTRCLSTEWDNGLTLVCSNHFCVDCGLFVASRSGIK